MEIKEEDILVAYKKATESGKSLLQDLFPNLPLGMEIQEQVDSIPITERINTWEDACIAAGYIPEEFEIWLDDNTPTHNERAFHKLRVIVSVLNEGWTPTFKKGEHRWYPWFDFWSYEEVAGRSNEWKRLHDFFDTSKKYVGDICGFTCEISCFAPSRMPACLFLRNEELANHCGRRFKSLWADYMLIRK